MTKHRFFAWLIPSSERGISVVPTKLPERPVAPCLSKYMFTFQVGMWRRAHFAWFLLGFALQLVQTLAGKIKGAVKIDCQAVIVDGLLGVAQLLVVDPEIGIIHGRCGVQ